MCQQMGLDCSSSCCLYNYCAETKLDCVTYWYRPFTDLYVGLGSVFAIIIGVSVVICIINFCVVYKFCQTFDENTESWVGGFSICDMFTCLLTCGMNRARPDEGAVTAQELDFTYRFRKSIDHATTKVNLGFGDSKEKRERMQRRQEKSINDYLNSNSKLRSDDSVQQADENQQGEEKRSNKCAAFCCIVFCCADANIYYGDSVKSKKSEKKVLVEEDDFGGDKGPPLPASAFTEEDLLKQQREEEEEKKAHL